MEKVLERMESLSVGVPLRNEPVQARSTARLAALLDAAAAVVDEIGFERMTTAMVADRAGASIGTVYRYFPDRIAVLQALGARNLERVIGRVTAEMSVASHSNWAESVDAALDIFLDAFRTEASFRSLRVGDVIDLRPAENDRTFNSIVSESMLNALAPHFDLPNNAQTQLAFETALEVADALAARAFAFSTEGDQTFIDAAGKTARAMLIEHFGEPQN
jgi:AcrR family transcriptional regulator